MVGPYSSDSDDVLYLAVSSLRTSVQTLESRLDTVELEMKVFNTRTCGETSGAYVLETQFDEQHPQLLTLACTPVEETYDHSQSGNIMVGQSADAVSSDNRILEQRLEQLESTVEQLESTMSSYDEEIQRLKSLTFSSMQHAESACE